MRTALVGRCPPVAGSANKFERPIAQTPAKSAPEAAADGRKRGTVPRRRHALASGEVAREVDMRCDHEAG